MRIIYDNNLISKFENETLFLDTSTLILSFASDKKFLKLLYDLKRVNCSLLTIPSVFFEFTRGSDSLLKYNERVNFFTEGLGIKTYPIERQLDDIGEFIVVFQKIAPNTISYTDFLLCCCLYKFKGCGVLTENHKDFPISILDRDEIITVDTNDNQIRNSAIYKLSPEKFEKASASILKTI